MRLWESTPVLSPGRFLYEVQKGSEDMTLYNKFVDMALLYMACAGICFFTVYGAVCMAFH